MPSAAIQPATYQDLLSLPEDIRAEILGGTIITLPAPLPKHSKAQRALGRFIGGPFDDDDGYDGPGGWWIFLEVDIQLGPHDIVRPDLSGFRRERLPDPAETRPFEVVPDWVCEVLSPSTAARDRREKRNLYAASGVPYYWLVDADSRTLEAFALKERHWLLVGTFGEDDTVRVPPFEAVALDVKRLFLPRPSP